MMSDTDVQKKVRQFYDQVGWQQGEEDCYQNTRYEDLRPVSREYIHRCHLRVNRFLAPQGRYFLDAGSGPVQYPEYLTYSEGYRYRVCVDLSIVALQEARKRLGRHGLYVVADVACLPFKKDSFDGAVSLHTLHHLPLDDQKDAYLEIMRTLIHGKRAVIVNGWTSSALMKASQWLVIFMEFIGKMVARLRGRNEVKTTQDLSHAVEKKVIIQPTGTYVQKMDSAWLRRELGGEMEIDIRVWRSVSVRFLRAVIHSLLGGRAWLRLLVWLEERFPRFFGEKGQYPLIILQEAAQ
jgi:SAM-dependent methyltransferase